MKSHWKRARAKWIAINGLRCPCCNSGLPKRRNNKLGKHRFNQMIRSRLRDATKLVIADEINQTDTYSKYRYIE